MPARCTVLMNAWTSTPPSVSRRRAAEGSRHKNGDNTKEVVAEGPASSGLGRVVTEVSTGTDLRPVSEATEGDTEDDTEPRSSTDATPRISFDYFFLGDHHPIRSTKAAAKMTNKQLRSYLREASIDSSGSRVELLARYLRYEKKLLE